MSIKDSRALRRLIKAYAPRIAGLRRLLGTKIKIKTKGLALFGLGRHWVLLAEQELTGPKGVTLQVTRRFSLEGPQVKTAVLVHDQWVVNNGKSLKKLASWAPAPVVVAAKKTAPAPAAATKPAPSKTVRRPDPKGQVRAMLNGWLKAWQGKRLKRYIGYYASDFQTKGMNRRAWYRHKRYLAKVYKVIRVKAKRYGCGCGVNRPPWNLYSTTVQIGTGTWGSKPCAWSIAKAVGRSRPRSGNV